MPTVYLVEEHHEVFWIWHQHQFLLTEKADLLHIDNHPDMDLPCFTRSLTEQLDETALFDLTFFELDIQTFITPAVYQGFFQQVTWLRPHCQRPTGGTSYVASLNEMGKQLMLTTIPQPDGRQFYYQWRDLSSALPAYQDRPLFLDIDLDFFSCGGTVQPKKIEITAEEYNRYHKDHRHYLRCHFGSRVRAWQQENRFYYSFSPLDATHRGGVQRKSKEAIQKTISRLRQRLQAVQQTPLVITICRSRLSGYTPADQWQCIEELCLDMLAQLYPTEPLKTVHIDSLLAKKGLIHNRADQQ